MFVKSTELCHCHHPGFASVSFLKFGRSRGVRGIWWWWWNNSNLRVVIGLNGLIRDKCLVQLSSMNASLKIVVW